VKLISFFVIALFIQAKKSLQNALLIGSFLQVRSLCMLPMTVAWSSCGGVEMILAVVWWHVSP